MKRLVLLSDPGVEIDVDGVEVVRTYIAERRRGGPLRRWGRRGSTPGDGPAPTEWSATASGPGVTTVVLAADPVDRRAMPAVPGVLVVPTLEAALALLATPPVEPVDVAAAGRLGGDPEVLYRVLPEPPGAVPRLVTSDDGLARRAVAAGLRVAIERDDDGPFLELKPDSAVVRGTVDHGWTGTRSVDRVVAAPPSETGSDRLLVAPANYAGQGWAWTRAANEHLDDVVARNVQITPRAVTGFAADRSVTGTEWRDPSTRVRLALDEIVPATHVIVEAMRALIGSTQPSAEAHGWDVELAAQDVLALHRSGRSVALLFHGSEVRRTDLHPQITASSPFTRPEYADATARLTTTTTHVHRMLRELREQIPTLRVFVSTPDLLDHVPGASWLPIIVPRTAFAPAPAVLEGGRPRVLHAPTNPFLKGSDVADEVLSRLDAEGVIHYRRVSGVPSVLMGELLREVDVVVDQLVLGNPGVLAAESMAAGRVVVAHLPEAVRARFPLPIPVVEADRESLDGVIRAIAADPTAARATAALGPAFCRGQHDGRASAEVLASFVGRRKITH